MKRKVVTKRLFFNLGLAITVIILSTAKPTFPLPPPEDVPEEILRTEIITEARSPIDGQPITAAEYALLQEQLTTAPASPRLNPDLQHLIFLLRVRKLIRTILPF
ncbi:MAG: glutathione S-transferase [Oscillatoriaceae bacterium SKW80]|nr:glutathione S-transferase [Oscillatoriaceae bacterium SKYG93]MCX8120277.1 glutathione S-transferase [Oscillatoriaceae bacterium SKW80]MDW8453202.1 glutathione S-transferase [Oscillatoriaceae cyanobacterium SKYGB_i_bin93]HIK28886.1 glutathione S-transferase [Oscillatoriaceae cyanobacterium M7585_C2015_266]